MRIRLTMVAESQRTHVALIDPLPAGLESLNPSLAVTQSVLSPTDESSPGDNWRVDGWWGRWYEHEQLRDDRTEAFTTLLPAGTYTYSYVAGHHAGLVRGAAHEGGGDVLARDVRSHFHRPADRRVALPGARNHDAA